VEEQLSNTLTVLKQVLAKLEQPQLALPPVTLHSTDPQSPRVQPRTILTSDGIAGTKSPVSTIKNPGVHLPTHGPCRNAVPFVNKAPSPGHVNIAEEHITSQEGRMKEHEADTSEEEELPTTQISDEMQRVLRSEDPDFQAPQPMSTRMSWSRAQVAVGSPKKTSRLKKHVKKGTETPNIPPVTPSHPGRLDPKQNVDAIPVGKPCWILHPDFVSQVVAYGKTQDWATLENKGTKAWCFMQSRAANGADSRCFCKVRTPHVQGGRQTALCCP
jgi:hypothetical protein